MIEISSHNYDVRNKTVRNSGGAQSTAIWNVKTRRSDNKTTMHSRNKRSI